MTKIQDIDEEIAAAGKVLTDLEEEKANFYNLPKSKRLAVVLHDMLCKHNHTDVCSWMYEEKDDDDWNTGAHKRWLDIANKLIDTGISGNDIEKIVSIISER